MSEQILTKRCPKCKQFKSLSAFSKHLSKKDGLQSNCKSCKKAYNQSEQGKIVSRRSVAKYQKTPKGKASASKYHQTPNGKIVHRKAVAKHRAGNPNYDKAGHAVNDAIKAGRLPSANTWLCHYCPAQAQQYHHWHGYEPEHWLDVVPACVECHKKEHRKIA